MAGEEVPPTTMTEERQKAVDLFFLPIRKAEAYVAWLGQVRDKVIRGIEGNEGFANWIISLVLKRIFGVEKPEEVSQKIIAMAFGSREQLIKDLKQELLKDGQFAQAIASSPLTREAQSEARKRREDDRRRYIAQHLGKILGMGPDHVNPDLVELAFAQIRGRATDEAVNRWWQDRKTATDEAIRRILKPKSPKKIEDSIASMTTFLSLTTLDLGDDEAVRQAILQSEQEDAEQEGDGEGEKAVPISPYFKEIKEKQS